MASTNKTTNYELSQYIGTDKPTYLGDYNGDMLKIDTGMKANETASSTNASNISTINSNIGTMSNLKTTASNLVGAINENYDHIGDLSDLETPVVTDVVSSINSLNTNVGDVTQLETDSKTSTVSAINEIVEAFNLTNIKHYNNNEVTVTNGSMTSQTLSYATNADGSIAKIYGSITVQCSGTSSPTVTMASSLRPDSNISISGTCIALPRGNNYYASYADLEIHTDGTITFRVWNGNNISNAQYMVMLPPCIYFIKDFGDVPVQP